MFASLKEKFQKGLQEFKDAATPQDALDKYASDLVDKSTNPALIAPDWGANIEVVDFINNEPHVHSDKVLKAIRRGISKPNTKIQLLNLTLLETCVKNCVPELHAHLAASDAWAEILKLAADSSITRVDAEVRDKMLAMVEDYARALQPKEFQAAYEDLLDRGVDFPVRAPEEAVPILTPPRHGDAPAPYTPQPGAGGEAPPGQHGGAAEAAEDLLAGVSEEDRAAIQAAMAEMEAEDRAAREAARAAAEAEAVARRQQQLEEIAAQQAAMAAAAQAQADAQATAAATAGHDEAARAAAVAAATAVQASQEPEEDELAKTQKFVETLSNSTMVLSEALSTITDTEPLAVREPFVTELADQCIRMRSRLERSLASLTDEALLASAISQHEELSKVLQRYEELLAAAESISPSMPPAAPAAPYPPVPSGAAMRAAAAYTPTHPQQPGAPTPFQQQAEQAAQKASEMASALKLKLTGAFDKLAAAVRPPGGAAPGPSAATGGAGPSAGGADAGHFTLLDDEDDGEESALLTKRAPQQQQHQQQGGAAATGPTTSHRPTSSMTGPDLINFDEDLSQAPAAIPVAASPHLPTSTALPQSSPRAAHDIKDDKDGHEAQNDNLVEALDKLVFDDGANTPGAVRSGADTPVASHSPPAAVPPAKPDAL